MSIPPFYPHDELSLMKESHLLRLDIHLGTPYVCIVYGKV